MAILHHPPGPPSLEQTCSGSPDTREAAWAAGSGSLAGSGRAVGTCAGLAWDQAVVLLPLGFCGHLLGASGARRGLALGAHLAERTVWSSEHRPEALAQVPGAPHLERGSSITGDRPKPPTRCRVDVPHRAQQGNLGGF